MERFDVHSLCLQCFFFEGALLFVHWQLSYMYDEMIKLDGIIGITWCFLAMAIDCRIIIANRLIAIHSDLLTAYSYQNTQIVEMVLFLIIIVINDTERTI